MKLRTTKPNQYFQVGNARKYYRGLGCSQREGPFENKRLPPVSSSNFACESSAILILRHENVFRGPSNFASERIVSCARGHFIKRADFYLRRRKFLWDTAVVWCFAKRSCDWKFSAECIKSDIYTTLKMCQKLKTLVREHK